MISNAVSVAEYISELVAAKASAIENLREIALKNLDGFEESMKYGMPTYTKGEKYFAFTSQKHYLSIYFDNPKIVKKYRKRFRANFGKNCIRFTKSENIDFDLIEELVIISYK